MKERRNRSEFVLESPCIYVAQYSCQSTFHVLLILITQQSKIDMANFYVHFIDEWTEV